MPRKARIDACLCVSARRQAPGAVQHIIIRGIERKDIFRDTTDKDTFIKRFGKIVIQTSTPCYAWVLMDNHAHLFLRDPLVSNHFGIASSDLITNSKVVPISKARAVLCYLCVGKLYICGAEVGFN